MPNNICHIELFSRDLGRSSAFYSKVFGWKFQPMGDCYSVFEVPEGPGGGLTTAAEMEKQATLVYIHVADIEQSLSAIQAAGGQQVHPKTKISDEHGFFALFADPSGTVVGLWSKS